MLSPFGVVPLWNSRGQPDRGYTVGATRCAVISQSSCAELYWPIAWSAFGVGAQLMGFFHGSLIEDKLDKAGTYYRRNRHYDATTGDSPKKTRSGSRAG